jgi:hypothetical protein
MLLRSIKDAPEMSGQYWETMPLAAQMLYAQSETDAVLGEPRSPAGDDAKEAPIVSGCEAG